ncbi:MAG TPA: response regulator transcription factor [Candidatus Binataceae bacterium]|nr:response regulator transcription factor [Candidatus Binataceae bacterium]
MIRALVVTTSALLRTGLESLVEIAGAAASIEEAAALVSDLDPDLIIVEWDRDDARELIELAAESPPVLALVPDPQPSWSHEALRAGVRGIVPRDSSTAEISAAIEAAAAGLVVIHPQAVEAVAVRAAPHDAAESLSPREIEVLRLIAEGASNKVIAWRLNISEHTVKFHVNSILSKMNAGSRTEAVMLGLRRGLIPL